MSVTAVATVSSPTLTRRSRSLPPVSTQKSSKQCWYYWTRNGCCWGSFCRYRHGRPKIKYVERPAGARDMPSTQQTGPDKKGWEPAEIRTALRAAVRSEDLTDHFRVCRNIVEQFRTLGTRTEWPSMSDTILLKYKGKMEEKMDIVGDVQEEVNEYQGFFACPSTEEFWDRRVEKRKERWKDDSDDGRVRLRN